MKKQIKLPSGDLGVLGTVNMDLEMTAGHYDQLTTASGDHNEEVVLSILKDLMEEDPYQLTQIDLMYLFTLVKMASIGSTLTVNTFCPNKIVLKSGVRLCSAPFSFSVKMSEDDVLYKEPETEIPTIRLTVANEPETFKLQLPTMAKELEIFSSFEEEGYTRRQVLVENKALLAKYVRRRCALHIKTNSYTTSQLVAALDKVSFKEIQDLSDKVVALNKYGLKHKKYTCQCKECGGKFEYHLPLLFGLSL